MWTVISTHFLLKEMLVSTSPPFLISDQNKSYLFDKTLLEHHVGGGGGFVASKRTKSHP